MSLKDYSIPGKEIDFDDLAWAVAVRPVDVVIEFIITLSERALEYEDYRALRDYFTREIEDD